MMGKLCWKGHDQETCLGCVDGDACSAVRVVDDEVFKAMKFIESISSTVEWIMIAVEHEKLAWEEYRLLANMLHADGKEDAALHVIEIMNDEANHRAILQELMKK